MSCTLLHHVVSTVILDGLFTMSNGIVTPTKTVECASTCIQYNYNGVGSNSKCSCVGFESTGGDDCKLLSCDMADTVDDRYFYQRNKCTVGKFMNHVLKGNMNGTLVHVYYTLLVSIGCLSSNVYHPCLRYLVSDANCQLKRWKLFRSRSSGDVCGCPSLGGRYPISLADCPSVAKIYGGNAFNWNPDYGGECYVKNCTDINNPMASAYFKGFDIYVLHSYSV